MKLSRLVPAHTKTECFDWIKSDFMVMSRRYREVRGKCCRPMDACFWCKHPFADGDMMALAGRPKASNVMLCQRCAAEAEKAEAPA